MARRTRTMAQALLVALGIGAAVAAVMLQAQRPVTAQTATPEIEVHAFTASVSGSTVDFSLTLCVDFAVPGTFQVKVWMNLAARPTCTTAAPDVTAPITVSSIGCQTIPFRVTGVAVGTYTTQVLADGTCAVPEVDEDNNVRSATYTVLGTVTYKKGPATYVGITSGSYLSNGGVMPMHAGCHAEYPGSRLCTERDIRNTYPTPLPPKDAWVLPVPGASFLTRAAGSGSPPGSYPACSGGGAAPFHSSGIRNPGLVISASGRKLLKRVVCGTYKIPKTYPVAYPAACCRP